MTISEAIEVLAHFKVRHGDVTVYFDCPTCKHSFTPSVLATEAVHFPPAPTVAKESR